MPDVPELVTNGETIHRPDGDDSPHGRYMARGALIEIIEKRATTSDATAGDSVIVPNEIRINGQPLLAPDDKPVIVHEIATYPSDAVYVTLTLIARRVSIRAEHDTEA